MKELKETLNELAKESIILFLSWVLIALAVMPAVLFYSKQGLGL